MRFELSPLPSTVGLDNLGSIECDALERIDSDEHNTTICVNAMLRISIANSVQNWNFDSMNMSCKKGIYNHLKVH